MTYYTQDPTTNKYVQFNTLPELVTYLEGMVQRANKITRKQYMQNLIELGYGYDDPQGATFTRALAEDFNIGVIRDGKYVKTDVHTASTFYKPEFGH